MVIILNNYSNDEPGKSGILTEREEISVCYAIGEWYLSICELIKCGEITKSDDLLVGLFIDYVNNQLKSMGTSNIEKLIYIIRKFELWKEMWPIQVKENKQHQLGYLKEKLKDMICGY
jgi:hypothetical protein